MNHYQHPKTKEVRAFHPELQAELVEKSLAEGFELMDEKAFEAFRNPPKTPAQLFEQGRAEIQKMLDGVAFEKYGFSNGNALLTYAGFKNPDQELALQFATFELSCWDAAKAIRKDVLNGKREVPSAEELMAELPKFEG